MFIFLPLIGMVMYMLYIGSGRYYVDHLLFVVHYHAFFFLGGLAHTNDATTAEGEIISLHEGMVLTAFDLDTDENGNPDNIIATGVVEKSPENAQYKGSLWSLRIDSDGIRHESDIKQA